MRHNDEPNILRVMVITLLVFWVIVYIGFKLVLAGII